jgi:hypothetical protein
MLQLSQRVAPRASVGDTISLKVDKVDRGPTDPPCIVCVVLKILDNGSAVLGCKAGRLPGSYFKNDYTINPERILSTDDVPDKDMRSLRSAVAELSMFGGQGYVHCNCKTGCNSNHRGAPCKCRKASSLCNYRCHSGRSCTNCNAT